MCLDGGNSTQRPAAFSLPTDQTSIATGSGTAPTAILLMKHHGTYPCPLSGTRNPLKKLWMAGCAFHMTSLPNTPVLPVKVNGDPVTALLDFTSTMTLAHLAPCWKPSGPQGLFWSPAYTGILKRSMWPKLPYHGDQRVAPPHRACRKSLSPCCLGRIGQGSPQRLRYFGGRHPTSRSGSSRPAWPMEEGTPTPHQVRHPLLLTLSHLCFSFRNLGVSRRRMTNSHPG